MAKEKDPRQKDSRDPQIGIDDIRNNRLVRLVGGGLARAVIFMHSVKHAGWRAGRYMKDPANLPTLLEGSMISGKLLYPDQATGRLTYDQPKAGAWTGYDFNRSKEFPKDNPKRALQSGSLFGLHIDEIVGNAKDEKTPIGLVHLYRAEHAMHLLARYTMQDLRDIELVEEKSYSDAYKAVGLYERYAEDIHSRGLADTLVDQVTPKGNTLVGLRNYGQPKPSPQPQLEAQPGFLPNIVTE